MPTYTAAKKFTAADGREYQKGDNVLEHNVTQAMIESGNVKAEGEAETGKAETGKASEKATR